MAVLSRSQVINAAIDEVWEAIVDGGNVEAWNPTIRASRQLDDTRQDRSTRVDHELEMRAKEPSGCLRR
jgi:uncharacterized protein YndB with AHSA1/START domain